MIATSTGRSAVRTHPGALARADRAPAHGAVAPAPEQRPHELGHVATDALAGRLAAVVQRRHAGRGPAIQGQARRPLLQRVNDKIAFVREPQVPAAVALTASKIFDTYAAHRARKTKARIALNESHHRGVQNLEARQDDLALAAMPEVAAALRVPYKGAAAKMPWRPKEDIEPIVKPAVAVLAERAEDAKQAREEYPNAIVATAAKVDAEIAKLNSDADLQAAVRAEIIPAISRQWGVTLKLAALSQETRTERFNKRFGPLMGKRRQKGFDLATELTAFTSGEQDFIRNKIALADKHTTVALPHPYAPSADAIAAEIEKILVAVAKDLDLLPAIERRTHIEGDIRMITVEHARHALSDPLVVAYEKGYIESGIDLAQLTREWHEAAAAAGAKLEIADRGTYYELVLHPADGEPTVIGRLYRDDQRFEQRKVADAPAPVYVHRETQAQYVRDREGLYVRRFVSRSLNTYDHAVPGTVSINVDPRKKKGSEETWRDIAETLPTSDHNAVDEQVWSHQRKKELQGGSPFVSATTTKHPIFGSTAKYFQDPQGIADIDLAFVPTERIVDTHQQRAYQRITKREVPDPDMPFNEGNLDWERNSAVRDAMRTREVAIIGSIPAAAVVGLHWQDWDADTLRIRRHVPDIDHGQYGRFVDPAQLERERQRQIEFEEYMRERRILDEL